MARRWTVNEENEKRDELQALYIGQNKTIQEVASILGIAESSVFDRMQRLEIPSIREQKTAYNNKRRDVLISKRFSTELAEFVGIMLGDGHLSPTQVLEYHPSRISNYKTYLTRKSDLLKYASEIGFSNQKHFKRAIEFGIIK